MFTGIIEEIGKVVSLESQENLSILKLQCQNILNDIKRGDSIAVNGVCLTVTTREDDIVAFDMMKETMDVTNLGRLLEGSQVNLERALKVDGRLNGHYVSGHVDEICKIENIVTIPNYVEFQMTLNDSIRKFIVGKGSVCIDGVSLTIGNVFENYFSVYLIPATMEITTFGQKNIGDSVNIEVDLLARYLNHMMKNEKELSHDS